MEYSTMIYTMLPNTLKYPSTVLPENESYSGHGDDHIRNFP